MADDKKPKIDLKARLGKQGGASAPAPTPMPPGIVPATRSQPPPAMGMGGMSASSAPAAMAPPGVPVGPPPQFKSASQAAAALDPSNPLSAVAAPYRPAPVVQSTAPAAPQRIEVDEGVIHEARRGARRQGLIVGIIIAAALGGVGFVAGGASEQGKAREKSKGDAVSLGTDLGKAKETLTKLVDKMDEGVKTLQGNKFPDKLASDLGGLNVAFDGTELAGRRFSGFPQDTTAQLLDFITSVQALNDRKAVIQGLLTKLQKPLTERLNAPPGSGTISMVAAVQKDPSGNPAAFLATLATPIPFTSASDMKLPATFTFTDPSGGSSNATAPRYTGGDISKNVGAIPIVPKTFDKVCPSEAAGGIAQLQVQIGSFIREIKGEGGSQDIVTDTKPGLLERADKLLAGLQKVQ